MLQKTIELGKQLTKKEMKEVKGGLQEGTGCVHTSTLNGFQCGLTKQEALSQFHNGDGGWDNWFALVVLLISYFMSI